MANTITIELCAEDRERLDKILTALEAHAIPVATLHSVEEEQQELAKEFLNKKINLPKEEVTTVTREAVQALVQRLAAPTTGKRDAVRNIVKEYADKVSEIAEDKLAEVMERLNALEV